MMNSRDELTSSLSEDVFSCLDHFFSKATANGVKTVTLDCLTRKVYVDMQDDNMAEEDEDPEAYLKNLQQVYNMETRAKGKIGLYKARVLGNPSVSNYQEFIGCELENLLRSDFLILDNWFYTDDIAKYAEELKLWGLSDENYGQRYKLLRQMLRYEKGRFEVNYVAAGKYLLVQRKKLTPEDMRCFFCFMHFCQLVNVKMDELEGATNTLPPQDQALLKRLLGYVSCGDWRMPATTKNIRAFLTELFENIEFRNFFKTGKAGADSDRVKVSMANILGYLMSHQLLDGRPKNVSIRFFGNDSQVNNINKGKNSNGSRAFINLIPLLDEYRVKWLTV